jgi:hypothetical protein
MRASPTHPTRRTALQSVALGFGHLALNAMTAGDAQAEDPLAKQAASASHSALRFPRRAKRVLFLFMHGGPSHIDLFDPKPALQENDGKPLPFKGSRVVFAQRGNLMKSPWGFRQHGEGGIPMSELWQHLPEVADELCMIHSMCDTNVSHGGACMKIHTGDEDQVRPSIGSWISYGLGTENENLPSFITICPTTLHGGVNNFGSAFLPAVHQGVPLGTPGYPNTLAKDAKFDFATPGRSPRQQQIQLEILRRMHRNSMLRNPGQVDNRFEARIRSFELAFRMQMAAPEAMDINQESQSVRELYGLDQEETQNFGLECLLARRFLERGVRFVQVSHAHSLPFNNEQWDQHSHLEQGHSINVRQIDKPITGLIKDLRQRGLLEDTLVVWGGEFGRTPTVQKGTGPLGRDHHPEGFTMWLAGAGVRGGYRHGATDDFGYFAVENRCTIHDLHATILYAMGLDHTKLTYPFAGRDFRLTDVHGEVADVFA